MKVIEIERPGGPEVSRLAERPKPELGAGEVLVRELAAGVNRPDVTQRIGQYPPPPGASDLPGLDIAGVVEARPAKPPSRNLSVNYAEYCKAPALQCLPLPKGYSFAETAALPEVLFTTWNSMVWLGRLAEGESVVIQGGTSGAGMSLAIEELFRVGNVVPAGGTIASVGLIWEFGLFHKQSAASREPDAWFP